MPEIRCPKCQAVIELDETAYTNIAEQVRNAEFDKALERQIAQIKQTDKQLYDSDKEKAVMQITGAKDKEIHELHSLIDSLKAQLQQKDREHELLIEKTKSEANSQKDMAIAKAREAFNTQKNEIALLKQELAVSDQKKKFEISEAVREIESQRDSQKAEYEARLKAANEQVEYYKDLKAKMSTKMIGETLEQHCENSFNAIRMTAFPRAQFGKDNVVSYESGSKGDYIFRDFDENGIEILSIMFEMKNEADTTSTKKKNEHFFKELDKDRREKKCEYAVLVSLLESDSELYNQGIVDVSYQYDKMYVIRPQFFIPMISILRNAAMHTVEYKRELQMYKNQNIDIENFEANLNEFKSAFSKNYKNASDRFADAIKSIDKSIAELQKVKDNLTKSENHLRLANNKAEDISIKKLTKDNPTMAKKFEELG
ncbi:MAG: DUF2130 domain-containing protein [Ruminococcus sp.]|nr:DUF2130 domain-containing protein [Ruminococcus sp.]